MYIYSQCPELGLGGPIPIPCPSCHGAGEYRVNEDDYETCTGCDGTGEDTFDE